MFDVYTKDPGDVLDYKFDFKGVTNGSEGAIKDWLQAGETISTYTVTVDTGLTKDSDLKTNTDTSITVWLSGGTAGTKYKVLCKITTSALRTKEKTIIVKVINH